MPIYRVNDAELYYEERGDGPEAILFVHGFLGASTVWLDDYMARLPERYRALAIDVRGHGRSSAVKSGCNLPQLAADVAQLVQEQNLDQVIYVGHSMGGAIGAQLLLDHPEIMRAAVLCNPGLGSTVSGLFRLTLPLFSRLSRQTWFSKRYFQNMAVHPCSEEQLERIAAESKLVTQETWTEYLDPANKITDYSLFGAVEVPTLVMIGGRDNLLPLDMQHSLAGAIPRAEKIVFEDEGHLMVIEASERVYAAIASFLERQP